MSGTPGGFRRLAERVIHAGHVITLVEGTFEAPDGSTFERDLIHHPGAVSIVAVDDGLRVTLVRQYRAALDAEILEIPAGKLDRPGEDPRLCAERELAEEVGLAAGSWELLCEFHNSPGFCDEHSWVFLARDLSDTGHDRQGLEEQSMSIEHVALADAVTLVRGGEVRDAKTAIGLLLAREVLGA